MTARPNWTARLAGALLLLIAGAALATWALARSTPAARLFGVVPTGPAMMPLAAVSSQPTLAVPNPQEAARLAAVEGRLAAVENATQRAQGSAGRADALLVAFAARRASDRGLALGYLEPLLVERFGAGHEQAVAMIITGSRQPVRLDALVDQYDALGEALRQPGPEESWWTGVRRELGGLVSIRRADMPSVRPQARFDRAEARLRRADMPSVRPQARFDRAEARLRRGEVDGALAETMRLPGVSRAEPWVASARRYIAVHRALDEIESAALLPAVVPAPVAVSAPAIVAPPKP